MSPAELEYTQGITGFQVVSSVFEDDAEMPKMTLHVKREVFVCKKCGSRNVQVYDHRERIVKGAPSGLSPVHIQFVTHKIYCSDCHSCENEELEFLSHPQARITKKMEALIQILSNQVDNARDLSVNSK